MLDLDAVDSDDVSSDDPIESENSEDRAFLADDIEVVSSPDSLDKLELKAELIKRGQELSSLDPDCFPPSPGASD
jgi:hypothetical protein